MIFATARSQQWALVWFSLALALFLIVVDLFFIVDERAYLRQEEIRHADNELDMMGKLLTEAMIRNDYVTVEQYVPQWGEENADISDIQVIAPNGFIIADYHDPASKGQRYQRTKQVLYSSRLLFSISVSRDLSGIDAHIRQRLTTLVLASLVTALLLGLLLWRVLKKTALVPLQNEIKERKQVEAELQNQKRELALYIDELEVYSYAIAHDLRAPVRAITSFSQLVLTDAEDKLDEQDKDGLGRVITAGKFMAELIDDILGLARITRETLHVAPLDLSAKAQASVATLQQVNPQRDVRVTIQSGLMAHGDSTLVQLLLNNLLENAWKYTGNQPDAQIEFGRTQVNGTPCFFVRDNGVGFDMQFVGKLFKPFQRLHGQEFAGTGIGLATVQRIMQRHAGRVWAESEVGKGTTFYFELPPG